MSSLFAQPYPISDSKLRQWLVVIGMGIFIFLFLYIFRPFGLNTLPISNATAIIAGYGLVCSIVLAFDLLIIPLWFPSIFNEEQWTVGKEIVFTLYNVLTIGIANAFYALWTTNESFSLGIFLQFQFFTLIIAVLPVTILVLIKNISLLRKNLKLANNLTDSMSHKKRFTDVNELVTIESDNSRDSFKVNPGKLLLITAADNYIELLYREDNVLKKKLVRTTLKAARENLRHSNAFYRCHRAWIVNLDYVESITGTSQGYRLVIEGTDIKVPVSRNLNMELTQRLSR